jgi:hypothetical protein
MKTMHTAWRTAAASAILIAGTAGLAAADNATTTTPSGQPTQQQTGATTAPATHPTATAPKAQPVKKKERIRRAERGSKVKP